MNGAAILATELDLKIFPVAIDGLHKVWPRRSMRIRPAKVKIMVGDPVNAVEIANQLPDRQDRSAIYDAVMDEVRGQIEAMIAEMRGESRKALKDR